MLCIERHGRAHEREGDEAASLVAATQFRKTRDCGHQLAYLAEIPEPRVSVTSVSGCGEFPGGFGPHFPAGEQLGDSREVAPINRASQDAWVVNYITPTNIGSPSSPWATTSPVMRS